MPAQLTSGCTRRRAQQPAQHVHMGLPRLRERLRRLLAQHQLGRQQVHRRRDRQPGLAAEQVIRTGQAGQQHGQTPGGTTAAGKATRAGTPGTRAVSTRAKLSIITARNTARASGRSGRRGEKEEREEGTAERDRRQAGMQMLLGQE